MPLPTIKTAMTQSQYEKFQDLKKRHLDTILLFRTGDFFKAYMWDAEKVATVLGTTIHKEIDHEGKPISTTEFPHHALDTYLPKMIRSGMRVAICEDMPQKEDRTLFNDGEIKESEPLEMLPEPRHIYKRVKRYSLAYKRQKFDVCRINGSSDVNTFARKFYGDDISIYESAFAIFLNRANLAEGYALIGQGGVNGTAVDVRLVCKYAVDTLSSGVVFVHNHPSGNIKPSRQDEELVKKLRSTLDLFNIKLVDSIILAPEDCGEKELYYSFNDNGKL